MGSTIEGLALWNESSNSAINRFELFADSDNDFSNANEILLETFNANQGGQPASAQIFLFDPIQTQYVHLNILSNHGDPTFIAAGEVAFAQSARVPFEFGHIPGIIGIVAAGGINYFRNKKRGKGERFG